MDRLYDGEELGDAAGSVLEQLPTGSVTLISTSIQGAGLAAACAAVREQPTRWGSVNPALPSPPVIAGRIVVVEALDAGAAWRDAMLRRFPGAEFIFCDAHDVRAPAGRMAAVPSPR